MAFPRFLEKIAPTSTRVERRTSAKTNEQIRKRTETRLATAGTDREALNKRLRELDEEWDVERTLQTNFAVVNLVSVALGALVARPWFILSGVAAGFMAEHALKGWCPPVPLFRRLGFRTAREINQERFAIKALRGDFQAVDSNNPAAAFDAASPRST